MRSCELSGDVSGVLDSRTHRSPEREVAIIATIAGGRSADELFLADSSNGVVRAFDARNGQLGRETSTVSVPSQTERASRTAREPTRSSSAQAKVDLQHSLVRPHKPVRVARVPPLRLPLSIRNRLAPLSDGSWYSAAVETTAELRVLLENRRARTSRAHSSLCRSATSHSTQRSGGGELWLAATCDCRLTEATRWYSTGSTKMLQWSSRVTSAPACWWPLFFRDNLLVYGHPDDTDDDWEVEEFVFEEGSLMEQTIVLCGRLSSRLRRTSSTSGASRWTRWWGGTPPKALSRSTRFGRN